MILSCGKCNKDGWQDSSVCFKACILSSHPLLCDGDIVCCCVACRQKAALAKVKLEETKQ